MIESLRIGCRIYRVDWPENGDIESDNHWGECDRRRGCITVASLRRPPDALAETLIHEVLHALIYDAGTEWDDDQEEQIVRTISPRLAAFMRDNVESCVEILNMLSK